MKVPAGQTVLAQGDESDLVYVIRGGEVDIPRELAGGGHALLRRLGSGQYVGELGPLLPRSATAVSATDLVLTAYDPKDFCEQVQAARRRAA